MGRHRFAVLLAGLACLASVSAPAHADQRRAPDAERRSGGGPSELTITGHSGELVTVNGYLTDFNVLGGYPQSGYSTAGLTLQPHRAGMFTASEQGGDSFRLYCIDIKNITGRGISYNYGTWQAGGMPNLGYVNRILHDYFPTTALPAGTASADQKAAIVQSAIWFFTNRFTLASSEPLFAATKRVVDDVLLAGPLQEPARDSLTIKGPGTGLPGTVLGPFTLDTSVAEAKIVASGGRLFTDAAGTVPLPSGSMLKDEDTFYVRRDGAGRVSVQASASVTTPVGSVFTYAPDNPARPRPLRAQQVVLAEESAIAVTVGRELVFEVPAPTPAPAAEQPRPSAAAEEVVVVVPGRNGASPRVVPLEDLPPGSRASAAARAAAAGGPGGNGLPDTGADISRPLGTALGLVGLGGVLMIVARRRMARR